MRTRYYWFWLTAVALVSHGCGPKEAVDSSAGDAHRDPRAAGGLAAGSEATDNTAPPLPENFEELAAELDQKLEPLAAKLRRQRSQELMAEYQALLDTYLNHGLGLAAKNPTAEETADLLLWAISRGNGTPAGDKARQMFVDHFADTDRVADLLMPAMYRPSPDDAALAERVLQINADHKSQAFATMLLAKHKVAREEFDGAEELLERIIDEFGDVDVRGTPLGDMVQGELYELRNLRIGMIAPDITAEDIDGTEFHLSDFRGKVLILDFWGDW